MYTNKLHTSDVEIKLVSVVGVVSLGSNLAVIDAFVSGSHVLYDEAPFVSSLVVIDT